MGSGLSGRYVGTKGSSEPKSGINYNIARSSSVRSVSVINNIGKSHSLPTHSAPNSVSQKMRNGKLYEERFYNSKGEPYLDIDYSNHSAPSKHVNPHQHAIIIVNGHIKRGRQEPIK